jgi:glucose-6-phosphate isomerase
MKASDQLPAWQALISHQREIEKTNMQDLFSKDPARFEKFSIEGPELFFDYSKNRITEKTIDLLCQLAMETGLPAKMESLFKGDIVNISEDRPAWHTALRDQKNAPAEVKEQLEKMRAFCDKNAHITDIVNIGIGG